MEAWRNLQHLRQELGMTDRWRKKLQYCQPPDEDLVDRMVEELRILEDLYMPLSPLVPLVEHLGAHVQMQDDMLAATDPIAAAAAKQKAIKRLSKHESKIAEMQEEFPSLVSETLERLHQLQHLALPVPVEEVYDMFGIPTEEELAADMERYMKTTQGRSSSEHVIRSIVHFRKLKKMQGGDAKPKKKKKARRDTESMENVDPKLETVQRSSASVLLAEENGKTPGSPVADQSAEPPAVKRRPARRKAKKADKA